MKVTYKSIIHLTSDLYQHATQRAVAKLWATRIPKISSFHPNYGAWVESVETNEKEVVVTLKDREDYDSCEYTDIHLSVAELEMSEKDWRAYIQELTQKLEKKIKREKAQSEKREREQKEKEYKKLQKELGLSD